MIGRSWVTAVVLALLVGAVACGRGQEAQPAASAPQGMLIALDPTTASVAAINVSSGETVAVARVGVNRHTWALFRSDAGELLISDLEAPSYQGRMRIFDVRDTSVPKKTIPMRDRDVGHSWAQAMALSEDERYLYYSARVIEETHPRWVGIIDLSTGKEIARPELPVGCGQFPTLTSMDGSSAQVFCPPNRFVTVDPTGDVSELMPFPLPTEAIESLTEPSASTVRTGRDEIIVHGCLGPGRSIPCQLGDSGRRLLAYGPPDSLILRGLLAYSEEDPTDVQQFELPEGIIHFAPIDATTVALLEVNTGAVYLFDLSSGEVTRTLQVAPGTQWLVRP